MTACETPERPLPAEYLPATGSARADLVLLHGWGGDREVWRYLLRALRPWANITLLDIPGCAPCVTGRSIPDLDGTLDAILERAPDQAVYVGYSLGGQLALALAARAPQRVRAVATVCSNLRFVAGGDWPGMPAATLREFSAGVRREPAAALRRFESLQVEGADERRALLRALRSTGRRSTTGLSTTETFTTGTSTGGPPAAATPAPEILAGLDWLADLDLRDAAGRMAAPRLHLLAESDALVPPEVAQAIRELPCAGAPEPRVELLPGCCHLAPLHRPAAVARQLEAFLDAHGLREPPTPGPVGIPRAAVADSFGRAASRYDAAARLQRKVGADLLVTLDDIRSEPHTVLDLGCGTGLFTGPLQARFPTARHLGLDLAEGMVRHAREVRDSDSLWLVADAESLPLAAGSVDLVFSSLAFQWCHGVAHLFAEIARVLAPGGKCVFTTLGPDTLHELRGAWAQVDAHQHVNDFIPAARLAAAARAVPGIDLRLEARRHRLTYPGVRDLLDELKGLGAHNMNPNRPAGMTSRRSLQGMLRAYEQWRSDGLLPATWEVIFGTVRRL